MQIKHIVTNNGTLLIEVWKGIISPEEAIENEKNILSNSTLKQGAVVLTDLRNATLSEITLNAIDKISSPYNNPEKHVLLSKTIVIAPDIDVFKKAEIYRDQTKKSQGVILTSSVSSASLLEDISENNLENIIYNLSC